MPANTASSLSKTPLDYIAEGYWQDFLAARPIAGGIAYEAQLYDCQLDASLASLQRVDTLITQVRRDVTKSDMLDETTLLADERYRNLLLFLAFYAGRVLAQQWQQSPHWYGAFELRSHYPHLPLVIDDFYQQMAMRYGVASDVDSSANADMMNDSNGNSTAPVFFALEPIGLRLFGNIDRQFLAVQGGQVASGLYQAVSALLPNAGSNFRVTNSTSITTPTPISMSKTPVSNQSIVNTTQNAPVNNDDNDTDDNINDNAKGNANNTKIEAVPLTSTSKPLPVPTPKLIKDDSSSLPAPSQPQPLKPSSASPTPDMFTQLLTELDEIEIAQTLGKSDYQQACKILDQFERHIAKQSKPRAQVTFLESHQTARQQALLKLQSAATLGNTAAMLRLAMYELLGEGLTHDNVAAEAAGADWVKQAAHDKDVRAQRLLSKMYYKGVGVPQDINKGKQWLEQAAENGHLEAASLVAQWQQAQALITTQKQEQHSIKRYQLLIAAVILGALLLIIFV